MKFLRIIFIWVIIFLGKCNAEEVKNLIYLIGDGMGICHITFAYLKFKDFSITKDTKVGLTITKSLTSYVTDSAAAAALACGMKTKNGIIAMTHTGKKLMTILEACKEKGKATGIVVTSAITHATPAAFASHVISRTQEEDIAVQLIENKVNVLFGGGKIFFTKRYDGRNLIKEAERLGYKFIKNRAELLELKNVDYVLGLFAERALKGEDEEPTLEEMTKKAIEILSKDEDGFFLLVEGSQIDWASHDNDEENTLLYMKEFDAAVAACIKYAKKKC